MGACERAGALTTEEGFTAHSDSGRAKLWTVKCGDKERSQTHLFKLINQISLRTSIDYAFATEQKFPKIILSGNLVNLQHPQLQEVGFLIS